MTRHCLMFFMALCVATIVSAIMSMSAMGADYSQPVGFHKIAINPGTTNSATATSLSSPYQRIHTYRGTVSSATSNTVTVSDTPGWNSNEFAPTNGFTQFMLLVRKDASTSPGVEGDWWEILSNTTNTVAVDSAPDDLSTLLGAGDEVEIRHLVTIRDLFGYGETLLLTKDVNGDPVPDEEDIIRYVSGTGLTKTVFYHDSGGVLAPTGYYVDGEGSLDGSTITLLPDEILIYYRTKNAAATNAVSAGQAQVTRFTHYIPPGAGHCLGAVYPCSARVDQSGLLESGWIADSNGEAFAAEEDYFRPVTGTGLGPDVFYHDGSLESPGWYVGGILSNSFPFLPTKAYIVYPKTNRVEILRWQQPVPFSP